EVPSLIPFQVRFVEKNPHQLGNRQRRVRIVELDGGFFRKRGPIGVAVPEAPYEVGERAGHEKIFLHEAQPLPHARGIVRVKYPREGFGRESLSHRADEISVAEDLKFEVIVRMGGPEAKRVDRFAAVTDYGPIKGDADQGRWPANDRA